MSAPIDAFDRAFIGTLNRLAGQVPTFDAAMVQLVDFDLAKGVVVVALYWVFWFVREPSSPQRREILAALLGVLVIGVVSRILQHTLACHSRPLHTPDLFFRLLPGQNPDALNHWGSFPSDHAAYFGALAVGLWRQSRVAGITAFAWTLVIVCLPRLYLGYHWPSDIAAGLALGVLFGGVIGHLLAPSRLVARLVAVERHRPAGFYGLGFLLCYQVATSFNELRKLSFGGVFVAKLMLSTILPIAGV